MEDKDPFTIFMSYSTIAPLAAFISHAGQGSTEETVSQERTSTLEISSANSGSNWTKQAERGGAETVIPGLTNLLVESRSAQMASIFDLKRLQTGFWKNQNEAKIDWNHSWHKPLGTLLLVGLCPSPKS